MIQELGVDDVRVSKVPFQEKVEVSWGKDDDGSGVGEELKNVASMYFTFESDDHKNAVHVELERLGGALGSQLRFGVPRLRRAGDEDRLEKMKENAEELAEFLDTMVPPYFELALHNTDNGSSLLQLLVRRCGFAENLISAPRRFMISAMRALSEDFETLQECIPRGRQGQDPERPYVVWLAHELARIYDDHTIDGNGSYNQKRDFVQEGLRPFGINRGKSAVENYLGEDPPDLMALPQKKVDN